MLDPKVVLQKLLEAVGIADARFLARLAEEAAKHPELADQIAAIEALLRQSVAPNLNPDTLKATLSGIARDIATGQTGVDPDAWQGSA